MLSLLILLAAMEVENVAAAGFTSRNVVRIERSIEDVYGALTEGVGKWWNPDHTYSGDAKNMSFEATAGGCLCEQLPGGGSVEHMHVVFVEPRKTLRLSGGLGPLQEMAVNGAMTFQLEASGAVHSGNVDLCRLRLSPGRNGDARRAGRRRPRRSAHALAGAPRGTVSHFFAYLSRMKFIKRWGLMRNAHPENVQEHSLRVAQIAHALALIRNRKFGGTLDADRVAVLALYHDASEVLTGDLPSPIKYFNPGIREAYHEIESKACERLLQMVPDELASDYESVLLPDDAELIPLVKAADKLCAYMKCLEETAAGNREFSRAKEALERTVSGSDLPEVGYFLETFVPSFRLTLDELG